MAVSVQVTFHNMDRSEAIEARIRERAAELEQFFDRITACRVAVDVKNRHQRKGRLYHVRIDLTVPGREIIVSRTPGSDHAHEDAHVAVRDAFDAARRQLADHARRVRGDVKTHEAPLVGTVMMLVPHEDYGFIRGADGEEIYFHRNSVAGADFDQLKTGDSVRFVAQPGESAKGLQASTVLPIGKHHPTSQRQ